MFIVLAHINYDSISLFLVNPKLTVNRVPTSLTKLSCSIYVAEASINVFVLIMRCLAFTENAFIFFFLFIHVLIRLILGGTDGNSPTPSPQAPF